jgi:hypothetical protein
VIVRRAFGLLASLIVACGARTGLRTTSDASPSTELVDGVVLKACAPNDGPAFQFSLGTPAPTCQVPGIAGGIGVIVIIWKPLPQGPGTFTIGDGSFASGSGAVVCDAKNSCLMAATGTLVLTSFTATSASGSYTLTTPKTTVSASFEDVDVCPNSEQCG